MFKERIKHAVTLFNTDKAPNIIFTGGYGDGAPFAESEVGINAVTSPTPTSRYRSFSKKFEFLRREIYFYSAYLVRQLF